MSVEEWRPVVGYEGVYSVSSLGRIRRELPGPGTRAGRTFWGAPRGADGMDYRVVRLSVGGQGTTFYTHHLVATAFLGDQPPGTQINHIDGVRTNNAVDNLEFVTPSENCHHAYRTGLRGTILDDTKVRAIRALTGVVSQRVLAGWFGVSQMAIWRVQQGQIWQHVDPKEAA